MGFCCNGFGWGAWGGLGILGPILGLVFFVGVVAVLGLGTAWLVRQVSRRPAASEVGVDPLEIARRRLAAGDISSSELSVAKICGSKRSHATCSRTRVSANGGPAGQEP